MKTATPGMAAQAAYPQWEGVLPEMTAKEAKAVLISELIYALKHRPGDFSTDSNPTCILSDEGTGQRWWIGNGFWHFKLWNPKPEIRFTLAQKIRAWPYFLMWKRIYIRKPAMDSLTQETIRRMMTLRDKNRP
jgi:hypothetical protein